MLDSLTQPYRVFVCKPSNNYGPWCFPKGRVDSGEGIEETALREVAEEAGVPAEMLPDGNLGTGVGSYSITHYFMMVRTGPVGGHDDEMEEVRCVTLAQAEKLFQGAGNRRDVDILNRARKYLESLPEVDVTESVARGGKKNLITELQMNLLGKVFFATLGAWLVGKAVNTKVRGSREQCEALSRALVSTRKFQEELNREGTDVETVMQLLSEKHASAQEFEKHLGIPWPL